ncbi:MAG: hypothetical protein EZS28_013971 [Streblomastix strix]|uniref:Uncharacterized protein n=1 Tax=Streblomastix strix TaxID=222440 RepID=A0A5J4W740_9EUKA|nr:MAG: hypothetical protein EZS28_013971 [Streblomastix strix]
MTIENYFEQSIFNNTSSANKNSNNFRCFTSGMGRDSELQQSNINSMKQIAITEFPEIVQLQRIETCRLFSNAFRKYLLSGGGLHEQDTIRQLGGRSNHQQKKGSAYTITNTEINLQTYKSDELCSRNSLSKGRVKFHGRSLQKIGECRRLSIEGGDYLNGLSHTESQFYIQRICNQPKRAPAQIHFSIGRKFSSGDQRIETSMGQGSIFSHPPIEIIGKCLCKIQVENTTAILVVPDWEQWCTPVVHHMPQKSVLLVLQIKYLFKENRLLRIKINFREEISLHI